MKNSGEHGSIFRSMTVRVGSSNAPKLESVRSALAPYADGLEVFGHAVDSGVPEQPVGLEEIARGARNRARAAREQGPCDLAVGIEDGLWVLSELDDEVLNVGVAVLTDGQKESVGLSSGFAYPAACLAPALDRRDPIGDVFDRYWQEFHGGEPDAKPSGLSQGNIGRLSLGVLPRSEYGRHAVLSALVRFLHPHMYFPANSSNPDSSRLPFQTRSAGSEEATHE